MLDYRWIEDLIDTDPKAMSVYLALLHLRFQKEGFTFRIKPSGLDILNEGLAQSLFAFYLAGKGEDVKEASNAGVVFIDRFFDKGGISVLDWWKRNFILEDIECRYYNRFTSAFKKYLRLNAIHEEFREMVRRVMLDVRNQLYPSTTTRCGSVWMLKSNLADTIKKLYGIKDEEVKELILNLIRSGLVFYGPGDFDFVLIPAPCISDEVMELIAKREVKPEVKPLPPPPVVSISERVENLIRVRPSREVLEGIVASVLEDLGFRVSTNVRLEARHGSPIEVDVWAQRVIGRTRFSIYVSCRNWDRAVDRSVIDEEAGRVMNLRDVPQLKVLIAKELIEPAREAAEADGFMVIELGRRAEAENSREVYEIVYRAFDELFTAIAPPRLREIAEKLAEIRENLMRVKEEISATLQVRKHHQVV
jgi:hypothetical protein